MCPQFLNQLNEYQLPSRFTLESQSLNVYVSMCYVLQYGFVNYALELLVVKTFGEETWEKIK
jgi:hypothetical protein